MDTEAAPPFGWVVLKLGDRCDFVECDLQRININQ